MRTRTVLKECIVCRAVKLRNSVDLRKCCDKKAMTVVNIVNGVLQPSCFSYECFLYSF